MDLRPGGAWKYGARLACAVALVVAGCGYRFTAKGGELPGNARTLAVPMFVNRTAEPGVEAIFTDALRRELSRAGREGGAASDAIAHGEVLGIAGAGALYVKAPGLTTGNGSVASYRVQATARVRVVRAGQTLKEVTVSGTEDYLPGNTILEAEGNRRTALHRLAADLMRQALESLSSGF